MMHIDAFIEVSEYSLLGEARLSNIACLTYQEF